MSTASNSARSANPLSQPGKVVDPAAGQPHISLPAIERMALGLRIVVEYTGFTFTGGSGGPDYSIGERGVHRCDYAITLPGGVPMGRLEISRHWPFKESDLRTLEWCVADMCLRLDGTITGEHHP